MGSKDWLSLFPDTGLKHYPIQISDHAPIEVDLNLTCMAGKRHFKLDAWALDFEECLDKVRLVWGATDGGSPAYRLTRKLTRVRSCVKKWTLDKKAEWNAKWDDFDRQLEQGIYIACNGGGEEEYMRVNEELRAYAAAKFWKQRAKIKWTVEGDTCTKFFFIWVKGRAGRNFIHGIKGEDGQWKYEEEVVSGAFQSSYMDLFRASSNGVSSRESTELDRIIGQLKFQVTQDEADRLSRPFTAKEICGAVFQMGAFKAPGPDGIPACFYQKCWFMVKHDFTKATLSILNWGMVLKELNRTFITLIPKNDAPKGLGITAN
ncbi:uncharacterized protein LOC141655593 [Silene latifolia]|uniref:uncharacterized protein LOC141655593 n=1 Tax=Silene latifolia TaxID=37657 RepID=UPI003D77F09D